jgi:hypothetical protein
MASNDTPGDSLYLFGAPSFLQGVADSTDLFGDNIGINESLNGNQADYLAMKQDWQQVGADIRGAFQLVAAETKTP